jgi:hypothetical protein
MAYTQNMVNFLGGLPLKKIIKLKRNLFNKIIDVIIYHHLSFIHLFLFINEFLKFISKYLNINL